MARRPRAVLFDVDGTLVDSTYVHVLSWWEAFRDQGHDVAMWEIHRRIGQGSDRLVQSLLGWTDEAVVKGHADHFAPRRPRLRPLPGAGDLLRAVRARGTSVWLVTSAPPEDLDDLLAAIAAPDAITGVTTADEAPAAKPDPDLVICALRACGVSARECLFVGDSVWDVEAAGRAGMRCVALCSGGISEGELRHAGALSVYRDPSHLLRDFDRSPLAGGLW